jgi:hypothetical protein
MNYRSADLAKDYPSIHLYRQPPPPPTLKTHKRKETKKKINERESKPSGYPLLDLHSEGTATSAAQYII